MKGGNIDEEQRILLISGSFKEVLQGFDMVLQVLHRNTGISNLPSSSSSSISSNLINLKLSELGDFCSINFLVDHNKTGRIIGNKGANLQLLKEKSGVAVIRIEKEPIVSRLDEKF
jgi:hypothetical protein